MNYGLTPKPSLSASDCLVLGIFSDDQLSDFAQTLDKEHKGLITKLSQKATETGDTVWQTDLQGHSLLLIQCGEKKQFTPALLKKRLIEITNALIKQRVKSATFCLPQLTQHSADWQLEQMLVQIDNQRYQLLDFKKEKP